MPGALRSRAAQLDVDLADEGRIALDGLEHLHESEASLAGRRQGAENAESEECKHTTAE